MAISDELRETIKAGILAFGRDPSYAITIAEQAGSLVNQQQARAEKIALSSVESSPVPV